MTYDDRIVALVRSMFPDHPRVTQASDATILAAHTCAHVTGADKSTLPWLMSDKCRAMRWQRYRDHMRTA